MQLAGFLLGQSRQGVEVTSKCVVHGVKKMQSQPAAAYVTTTGTFQEVEGFRTVQLIESSSQHSWNKENRLILLGD